MTTDQLMHSLDENAFANTKYAEELKTSGEGLKGGISEQLYVV